MPVGCLGNTSSSDQKDLRNHSISGYHLDEGGGNGATNQVSNILGLLAISYDIIYNP